MANEFIAKNGFISKGDSNTEGRILSGGTDIGTIFAFAGSNTNSFVTGFTYNNSNRLTLNLNNATSFDAVINEMSGLTISGTLSATTLSGGIIYSGGTELSTLFALAGGGGIYDGSGTVPTGTTVAVSDTLNFGSDTLFIDGTNSVVGIGTSSPSWNLHILNNGNTWSKIEASGANNSGLILENTTNEWRIYDESTTGALIFRDVDNGTYPIKIEAATPTDSILSTSTQLVINEDGNDYDFRVEGDTDTNLLFVDASTDRVGIGTATPSYRLHVSGDTLISDTNQLYFTDNQIQIGAHATDGLQIRTGTGAAVKNIVLKTNGNVSRLNIGTSEMVVNDPGNDYDFRVEGDTDTNLLFVDASTDRVGIGTATPSTKVHISDSTSELVKLGAQVTSGTVGKIAGIGFACSGTQGRWKSSISHIVTQGSFGVGDLIFCVDSTADGNAVSIGDEKMRIDYLGNVGIGTSTPNNPLHINSTYPQLRLQVSGSSVYTTFGSGTGYAVFDITNPTTNTYEFRNAGTAQLTIQTGGNVGVGTNTPSRTLDVEGVQGWQLAELETAYINPTATGTDFALKDSGSTSVIRFDGRPNGDSFINNGGSMGIGTTTPSTLLHVEGTGVGFTIGDSSFSDHWMNFRDNTLGVSVGLNNAINAASGGLLIKGGSSKTFSVVTNNATAFDSIVDADIDFHIDGSGNVGIGTTTPSRKLTVYDTSNPYLALQNSTTGTAAGDGMQLQVAGSDCYIVNYEAGFMQFYVNGAARQHITSAGNVGIGTISPSSKLHIEGTNSIMTLGSTSDYNTSPTVGIHSDIEYNAAGLSTTMGKIVFGKENTTDGNTAGFTAFYKKTTGAASAEAMRIDSSGNVGIGTATPSEKLTVSGSTSSGIGIDGAAGQYRDLSFYTAGSLRWLLRTENTAESGSDAGSNLEIWSRTDAGGALRDDNFTIKRDTGNVGIGTTAPDNKLQVAGLSTLDLGYKSFNGIAVSTTYTNQWQKVFTKTGVGQFDFWNVTLKVTEQGATGGQGINADVHIGCKVQNFNHKIYATIVNNGRQALSTDNFEIYLNTGSTEITVYHRILTNYMTPYYTYIGTTHSSITNYGTMVGASLSGETNDAWDTKYVTQGITTLASNGNVGIGTTAPTEKLHVAGVGGTVIEVSDSTAQASLNINAASGFDSLIAFQESDSNRWALYSDASTGDDFRLYNYGRTNTDFFVDGATGYVAIGNVAPTHELDVQSTLTDCISRVRSTVGYARLIIDGAVGQDSNIQLMEDNVAKWYINNDASTGDDLKIYNYTAAEYGIVIDGPTNKIALGHLTPDAQLHSLADNSQAMIAHVEGAFAGYNILRVERTGNSTIDIGAGPVNSGGGLVSSEALRFSVSGNSLTDASMYIETDGKVGIGTSAPTSKLEVVGNTKLISDGTMDSDTGHGDIVTFGTGTLTLGDFYYLNSSLVWTATDADAAASATGMIAIAMGTSPSDGMLIRGFFRHAGYTFSNGDILYLSNTAGAAAASIPTGTAWSRIIGYCISATNDVIYFNPSNDWEALAG